MTQNSQKRSNSKKERIEEGKDRSELDLQLARERVWDVEPFCIRESSSKSSEDVCLFGRNERRTRGASGSQVKRVGTRLRQRRTRLGEEMKRRAVKETRGPD